MQEQESVQEQEEPRVSPEEVEDAMFEEAMALVEAEDGVPQPKQEEETDQADPDVRAEAEDAGEDQPAEAPKEAAAPPDPFADATPEQKQAWQNLLTEKARYEHDSLSNRNRVSALQKKLNQLEKVQGTEPQSESEGAKPAEKVDLVETEEGGDLSEFKEDFPEIYKAVNTLYRQQVGRMEKDFQARLQQVTEQLETVAQPVQQMQETEVERYRTGQLDALKAAHPDWKQIQETKEFWSWVDEQTDGIKALSGSAAAQDNIALLNLYKSQMGLQTEAPAPAGRQTPSKPKRQADVAIPRVNSGGRPHAGIPPKDGDKAFDYWMEHWEEL